MIKYIENSCDACGSKESEEIKCLRKYTKNQPIHVCKNCGLIYVKKRRPPKKLLMIGQTDFFIIWKLYCQNSCNFC